MHASPSICRQCNAAPAGCRAASPWPAPPPGPHAAARRRPRTLPCAAAPALLELLAPVPPKTLSVAKAAPALSKRYWAGAAVQVPAAALHACQQPPWPAPAPLCQPPVALTHPPYLHCFCAGGPACPCLSSGLILRLCRLSMGEWACLSRTCCPLAATLPPLGQPTASP